MPVFCLTVSSTKRKIHSGTVFSRFLTLEILKLRIQINKLVIMERTCFRQLATDIADICLHCTASLKN